MMPSTEDSKLHATVSGLRFALQETQLQLGHAQHQVDTLQQRARQVNTLEVQYQAQVERADSVTEEMQSAREEAARSISDSMLQQDAAMKQAQEAREASQQAHHQLQKAQHAQLAAEQQRQQAEASLRDVRLHMDWQETRIADLESQDIAQTARRYDSELQSMKQQLQQDRQRLEAQLLQEKRAREGAENQLHHTMSLSQSFSPNSSNLGSPRKGRENSSPNKPRGSARLQESVVLRAQFQQSREAAEREAARWKAALEEEQHTSEKLRQQLNQLEESDQLVATAAANSQQQVHHLRQQLESEKTRTAVLDANLQAAAHSVRSSKAFKRRQRSRYTVQDSARMDDGHVDDHSWQHALGLTDNDTGSSAEEDDGDSHMDLGLQPVMVTVGLQTDDVALTALLAGTAGKDSLMTAARQEILRLKDVYSRLLQQRSPGVDSGPVVAEKEAEAAVAAAREAAHHQHEQALQRCNADWTARLDALKAGLQEAKAEAQRVRDCQAQLSRQHQVELQQAKTASEDKAAALQADITHLQERLAAAEADLAAAQARVQQLEQQLQTQQAEAAATEKRMTAQMEQLKMDADTDLAMVMLESSSNASEAASRLGSIRTNAEASKLAAVAELQQQLDAEREHRQQLQQQLLGQSGTPQLQSPVSVAASEEPSQAVAGPKASAQAGAGKDMTLAVVSVRATDDVPKGAEARGQAAEDCTEGTAPAHAEPASSSSRAVDVAAQDRAVPIEAGVQGQQQKAKGKADGRLSRGLQLPQKLSIASLAKHAGVDKAFMQDWIASVKVPSEEATALSRMADAAAAAAAFTAEGLRDDLHRPSQQAQRAELAKRAQQASDAVLRGDADQGLVQEPDRRSYSRWSGMDAGDDDMCRTSSAVATPESSYATARAVPVSVSHHSVSSGHSSRKGHLPPVYTTSPVIQHRRLHQSSALQSATSPFATALPFSAALPLSPGHRPASPQADTPRFATLGQANPRKSVYESSSHDPHRSSHALEGSAVSYGTSSHALMPSSYSDEPSASASQHHATTREGRALSHADHRASSHTHSGAQGRLAPAGQFQIALLCYHSHHMAGNCHQEGMMENFTRGGQHGSSAGPESLLMPESQYLHPSPELDSLSQRLREQKLAMSRQGQTGISPLEPEAGYSPGKGYSAYKHAASRIGVQHIHQEGGRTNLSPSRLAGGGPGPEAGRAWSPLPQGQGRSWSALGNDDASSDLQASMYHRERSRLQEALARQHAASAATSIAAGANPLSRSGSPWDSAWDQQSAATRGHSHESHGRRQSNLSSARHQEHSRALPCYQHAVFTTGLRVALACTYQGL
ncbi:hypothetical protein WJX82_001143 [Trebouxia sp. C0006]